MRVLIIGATGFIGRELMKEFSVSGHNPVGASRNAMKAKQILGQETEILEWDGRSAATLADKLAGFEAIVNLAGENIAAGRWTRHRKMLITESRINTSRLLAEAIEMSTSRPSVLLQGSAIGYYGTPVENAADETRPAGKGFVADLTGDWESAVKKAEKPGTRVIWIRTGLVLGKNGGLLNKMLLPFKFYSGTVIGSGKQWMSWIHIHDQVSAIRFLLENGHSSGAYNLTAPQPVRMKEFIKTISKVTGKPAWLKVPGWVLKSVLGEMADETVLASQNIYPGKLLKEGFHFKFDQLEPALKNLLNE
jgi:uncharacterized protein (TIGR01777 family)